jgi:carboxylate-amine ligase
MDLKYNSSPKSTIGIEIEMRILDKDTLGVKNLANTIFESIDDSLKPYIHKELLQSMFEFVTPICKDAKEAVDFIENAINEVAKIGEQKGFYVAALATHPFEKKEDSELIQDPRYEAFKQEFQIVIRNFLISGLHIHVGIENEINAIKAYNSMINYLPLFLALSANSPFFHGENTGLKSYRTKVFDKLPRAGVPQYLNNYDEYKQLYKELHDTGMIEKPKDVWWDVRISPDFGTLELRVCDAFYEKDRLGFITLLYQAIIEYAKIKEPNRQFHQINLQNKWNATRHGLNGIFLEDGKKMTIRQKIVSLCDEMSEFGIFDKLGSTSELEKVKYISELRSPSTKLRDIFNETNDFKKVLESQIIKVKE